VREETVIKILIIKQTLFRKSPLAPLFQRGVLFLTKNPLSPGGRGKGEGG